MDSDWLSIFFSFISWKKIYVLKVIPTISFLCVLVVSCGVDSKLSTRTIIKNVVVVVVTVIVPGENGPLCFVDVLEQTCDIWLTLA